MTTIIQNATDLIGHTPLLKLTAFSRELSLPHPLYAKLEGYNLTGSMKDRIALAMIRAAEKEGTLVSGGTIIEPTSGNTGIGLAAIGAALGYRVVIVMPDSMSVERRTLMQVYGAELVLTPGAKGMAGAIAEAERLQGETPNAIIAGQFTNMENPNCHYRTTGPEIWRQMEGQLDVLVAGVGTGGSLSGAGRYIKEQNPEVQIIAVEPADSAVLSGSHAGPHGLQGIGAGFVPATLDTALYDQVVPITEKQAWEMVRILARHEGVFAGVSSGAALAAAAQIMTPESPYCVVILPDTGMRYLSSPGLLS